VFNKDNYLKAKLGKWNLVKIERKHSYKYIFPILRITNLETMRNFEVKARKYEVV
jgi:hypothetical protein